MSALKKLQVISMLLSIAIPQAAITAEMYPGRPIRLVVPFPPGGGPDILARIIGKRLSEGFNQQVVVDDRPGATGIIGSEVVAHASPDGYTLIMGNTATHAINISLYKKLPYDPLRDFEPVSLIASTSSVLVVHPALPVRSVKDLIRLAKARPGALNYASAGSGTFAHLAMELFKNLANINIVHIPYKGNPAALVDLISGQVQVMFPTVVAAIGLVKGGKIRVLAVTGRNRTKLFPSVPTMSEAGVSGYEATAWYGVLAPANTPAQVVKRLSNEIAKDLKLPDVREQIEQQGGDAIGSNPDEFREYIRKEIAKWRKVIDSSGARVD